MRRQPTSCQLVLIDELLLMLARRMYGALDLGLVLLLESPREGFPRFVAAHVASPMRALSSVLVLAVAEAQERVATSPFDALVMDTERFVGALDDLGHWQLAEPEAVRDAVERLGHAARRINDTLLDVGERLCFEPSMGKQFGPDRHTSSLQAIETLTATLVAARAGTGCDGEPSDRQGQKG